MSNREQLNERLSQMPPDKAEAVAAALIEEIDAQDLGSPDCRRL